MTFGDLLRLLELFRHCHSSHDRPHGLPNVLAMLAMSFCIAMYLFKRTMIFYLFLFFAELSRDILGFPFVSPGGQPFK